MSGHKPFRDLVNSPVTDPQERGVTDAALLPCPFCGEEPSLVRGPPGCAYVRCTSCGASGDDTRGVEKWNTRHSTRPVDGDEQEVEGMATALIAEVEQQTDESWPVLSTPTSTVGLVDAYIDFAALARAALAKQPSPDLPSLGSVDGDEQEGWLVEALADARELVAQTSIGELGASITPKLSYAKKQERATNAIRAIEHAISRAANEALAKQPSPDESLDEAEGEEIMRSAPRQAGHYDAADRGSPDLPSGGSVDEVETWESINQWCDDTFGPATSQRMIERAKEEFEELEGAATDEQRAIEAADVTICLCRIPGFADALQAKMKVNRARKWRLTGEGTGYHIPAALQANPLTKDKANG